MCTQASVYIAIEIRIVMRHIIFSIVLLYTSINHCSAQSYRSSKVGINFYLGTSNLMGDLGGSDFIGNRGLWDYDIRANRIAGGFGATLYMGGSFSIGVNTLFTRLAGKDEYSKQDYQMQRNLSVRTDLIEADLLVEYRPFSRSKGFNRFYIYSGVGGMYYQPKAKLNDDWYKLRTLGTEGQYLDDGPGPYKEIDIVIPYGLGYKFRLGKSTSIILDLGFRKTFTDYIDDVSTVYADPVALVAENGNESAVLADRSSSLNSIGSPRGDSDKKDSYHVLSLKFEYILGGRSGDGCNYNRNPPKSRSTRINQRRMFTK